MYVLTIRNHGIRLAWRRSIKVIASASRTEDPWLESRQGVSFLVIVTLQCCYQNLTCIVAGCRNREKLMLKIKIINIKSQSM
jgi:hypothetical protein